MFKNTIGIVFMMIESNEQTYAIKSVVDPHFWNRKTSSSSSKDFCEQLEDEGWIRWKCVQSDFCDNSFYNFCVPQLKSS